MRRFFDIIMEEKNKLISFNTWRKESIDLLTNKRIGKNEFLEKNYEYLKKLDLKPFSNISSVMEAIYNYQYYNIMAKRSNSLAFDIHNNPKKKKYYKNLINNRENFYHLKDIASLRLLELVEYSGIEAYYIKLRSKRLTGEIFEIVLKNHDKLILHSKSKNLLRKLVENNCFDSEIKESKIDSYVNKSY
ncbi:DUF6648 family protein [Anaerococcus porci]|uniref:DUF6648 family protein n=1 Tax=Anaerococcus porci TaxID=2652269 RepID=UPI0038996982